MIIIDCVNANRQPGTVLRFAPDDISDKISHPNSLHQLGLKEALSIAEFMGKCPQTVIVGIQPQEIGKYNLELTPAIRAKVPKVVDLVIGELRALGIVALPTPV